MDYRELVERRIAEVEKNKYTDLYLSHCNLTQIPDSVFALEHLHHLDLKGNRLVFLPRGISRLKNLKGLYLNQNKLKEIPDELCQLTQLQVLKLDGNRLKRLPEEISKLEKLTFLYLSDNQLKMLPAELFKLRQLKVLYASDNRIETLPKDIYHLNKLEVLDLTNNRLMQLPVEMSRLLSLQLLYLSRNQLANLPLEMFQLTHLIRLDLNFNKLKELPEDIALLDSLRILNLEGNRLEKFSPDLFHLENLNVLNLDGNRIHEVPEEIFRLKQLEYLSLSRNRLKRLPRGITQLKSLVYSGIDKNPLEIPPVEIAGRGIDAIRNYFAQLQEQGEDCLYEADLLLLGESGVGKTSLAHKLLNPRYTLDPLLPSTRGVEIQRWIFPGPGNISFRANIRDFSGQERLRLLHNYFITKRSLAVVVLDDRQEERDFSYWFRLVQFLISRDMPVIIVVNEKVHRHKLVPAIVLESFARLPEVYTINLSDNSGVEELAEILRQHLKTLPHIGKEPLPKKWIAVRKVLEAGAEHYISQGQFLNICRLSGMSDENHAYQLAEFLHDLGIIFNFPKDILLQDTLILNPGWVTAAFYQVLTSPQLANNNGRLDSSVLVQIWDSPPADDMRVQLLRLMVNLELCYETSDSAGYIFPSLLPVNAPGIAPFHNAPDAPLIQLRYRYSFMPPGIIGRLIVRLHEYIYPKMVWRSGVLLQIGDALVEIMENQYAQELRIRIRGESKADALVLIREEIKNLHSTYFHLDYNEMIPCNCSHCAGQRNPHFYAYSLLRNYMHGGRFKVVCDQSIEDVVIYQLLSEFSGSAKPQVPLYDRIMRDFDNNKDLIKKRNKLFVAYALSDSPWMARVRTHLKEFEDEGFELDIWDDAQLKLGSKWEREIARALGEAKIIMLLISTDFLSIDSIAANELPPMLEVAEKDGAVVLPIILKPSRFTKNVHLAQFQPINDPASPFMGLSEARQEEILVHLMEVIDENLRDVNPSLTH